MITAVVERASTARGKGCVMRRIILTVVALALVGVVTGVTVAQSAPKSSKVVFKRTLVFTEKDTTNSLVDNPPAAKNEFDLSLGDQLVFSGHLLKHGDVRGGIGAHCIVVGKKPTTVECEGTAKLPGGKITLQTSFQFTKNEAPTTIAITGGTGAFRNARGYLVTKNNVDTFYIEP
jgi:hypothetical protein